MEFVLWSEGFKMSRKGYSANRKRRGRHGTRLDVVAPIEKILQRLGYEYSLGALDRTAHNNTGKTNIHFHNRNGYLLLRVIGSSGAQTLWIKAQDPEARKKDLMEEMRVSKVAYYFREREQPDTHSA